MTQMKNRFKICCHQGRKVFRGDICHRFTNVCSNIIYLLVQNNTYGLKPHPNTETTRNCPFDIWKRNVLHILENSKTETRHLIKKTITLTTIKIEDHILNIIYTKSNLKTPAYYRNQILLHPIIKKLI